MTSRGPTDIAHRCPVSNSRQDSMWNLIYLWDLRLSDVPEVSDSYWPVRFYGHRQNTIFFVREIITGLSDIDDQISR